MSSQSIEEALVSKLRELPLEKQQELLDFANSLEKKSNAPRKSLYGIWKGKGVSVSEEDIAEAREEMWEHFPREQFFG